MIKSQTQFQILLRQKKRFILWRKYNISKGKNIFYSWDDSLKKEKLLALIDNNDVEIKLNEIKVISKVLKINRNNNKRVFFISRILLRII